MGGENRFTVQAGSATTLIATLIDEAAQLLGIPTGIHTITNRNAMLRGGPPDYKPTGKKLDVGTRVDVTVPGSPYASVSDHATGAALGWTSTDNFGDVQYAKAQPDYVYVAQVKPRDNATDKLPVMVYLSRDFKGDQTADVVLFLHGDVADYSASKTDNFDRENPAIGAQLAKAAADAGRNAVVIAPQINEWGPRVEKQSPWHTLHDGDFDTIVQAVFDGLQQDLKLAAPPPRGAISITGHSGGGKGLGGAVADLEPTGLGVADVTLQEAGYRGGEDKNQKPDDGKYTFAPSFQKVRDWLLEGKDGRVVRVVTKAKKPGDDTRHAIENAAADSRSRIPVLGIEGVKAAIARKGLADALDAGDKWIEVQDAVPRTGGMRLIRKIEIKRKDGGATKGTIFVFLMADPPRASGIDPHFGVRDNVMALDVSEKGQGETYGAT